MKHLFDENLIELEFSKLREQIEEEYSQMEKEIIDQFHPEEVIGEEDTESGVREMIYDWHINEKIFSKKLQKMYVLAKNKVDLYIKHSQGEELTDSIVDYITDKMQQTINNEKNILIEEYKDYKERIAKIEKKGNSILNAIVRDLKKKKAAKQRKKLK